MNHAKFSGLLVPAITPFTRDLVPDPAAFVGHAKWLLDEGAGGLAPFGTTSEANSLSVAERMTLLEALVEGGIKPALLMPGTGCVALPDSIALTAHAVALGVGGVLMLPPFYYKGVSDDGLFASYAEIIERVGDARLQIYLYHIPPQAVIGISLDLIERLRARYPDTIAGIKDSSGEWENTAAILKAHPDLTVFPGSEVFLMQGLGAGAAGCITATGNINPAGISAVYNAYLSGDHQEAVAAQEKATAFRQICQDYPLVPAIKALLARKNVAPELATVRPPLLGLDDARADALEAALRAGGLSV